VSRNRRFTDNPTDRVTGSIERIIKYSTYGVLITLALIVIFGA